MRILFSLLLVLLAAMSVSNAARAAAGSRQPLLSNDGNGAVLAFELEGVSLLTPLEDVPGILEARGYTKVDGGVGILRFVKGDYEPRNGGIGVGRYAVPGGLAYEMQVSPSSIHFSRLHPKVKKVEGGVTPGPLPDAIDFHLAKDLKALICGKIVDPTVKRRACPPNTATRIPFMAPNRRTRLTDQDFLQRFNVNGHASSIHLIRYQ